jgi:hypothetical protein
MRSLRGGGKFSNILSANSKGALPSRRTVDKKMKESDFLVNEGEVNIRLLVQVLRQQNLPFRVALAEVAVREYDTTSNRIFGFSLPLSSNGNTKTTFIKLFS